MVYVQREPPLFLLLIEALPAVAVVIPVSSLVIVVLRWPILRNYVVGFRPRMKVQQGGSFGIRQRVIRVVDIEAQPISELLDWLLPDPCEVSPNIPWKRVQA